MSTQPQVDFSATEREFRTEELSQAIEYVQAMESRGDFKFKGIFTIFNSVLDWTNKFSSSGVLPTMDQVGRGLNMPSERLRAFLSELIGRGNGKTKFMIGIPSVDYIPASGVGLQRLVVFCRPTKVDNASPLRYISAYRDKSIKALSNWIDGRAPGGDHNYASYLQSHIDQGRLNETQAGAEISRLFYSDFDINPEHKKLTYVHFARPVIRALLESRHLILLSLPSDKSVRGAFYNKRDDLEERFQILARYFYTHIDGRGVISNDDLDSEEVARHVLPLLSQGVGSLPVGQRQVVTELAMLAPAVKDVRKKEEERKRQDDLNQLLEEVQKSGRVVDSVRFKNYSDDIRDALRRTASILSCDFPFQGRVAGFVLHKERVGDAVLSAKELYDRTGNDLELQVLLAMDVDKFLSPDQLKIFNELQQQALFNQLPFLVRFWRSLFGGGKLNPSEQAELRAKQSRQREEERLRLQKEEAKKASRKMATERMKERTHEKSSGDSAKSKATTGPAIEENLGMTGSGEPEEDRAESAEESEKTEEAIQAAETLKKMVQELDHAWSVGEFPNREFLHSKFPKMDENELVLFLKKYGRKEIISFRINHDKPEYVWPILISRRYLKQHGKKMQSKAMEEADVQRNALMPNQEKFDIATSMEDFLNRVLQKLN